MFWYGGGSLSVVYSEETDNRFHMNPKWLIAVSATRFPAQRWNAVGIPGPLGSWGLWWRLTQSGWLLSRPPISLLNTGMQWAFQRPLGS